MSVSMGFFIRLAAATSIFLAISFVTGCWNNEPTEGNPFTSEVEHTSDPAEPGTVGGVPLYAGWPKEQPDAVLVLSGQTFGYMQPCGCSRPQLGGLERRANLICSLQAKGWYTLPIDLGDITAPKGINEQIHKKYEYTMRAMKEMGYRVTGLGKSEFAVQLFSLLAKYTLNKPNEYPIVLAGNLAGQTPNGPMVREKFFPPVDPTKPDGRKLVEASEIITQKDKLTVGVIGLIAPSVAKDVQELDKTNTFDFDLNSRIMKEELTKFANSPNKPDVNVVMYQGTPDEAKQLVKDNPQVQVIVCLSDESEPEPRQFPTYINNDKTLLVQVGHKGRYVGLVGIFKTDKGIELKYQLIPLGEEYLTPDNPEAVRNDKVLALMELYAEEVKKDNLLAAATVRRPKHPAQIKNDDANLTYIGSEECRKCHANEFAKWTTSKHSHAYEAIEKLATRPGLRNFDPECVICHTTGFEYQSGFESKVKTPQLVHNGCENCHGPGSGHAKEPKNKDYLAAMMPWKAKPDDKLPTLEFLTKYGQLNQLERGKVEISAEQQRVIFAVSNLCMKCHDAENDPKFDFFTYMPQIYHSGLKNAGLPPGIGK